MLGFSIPGDLAHEHRFAGEERFVNRETGRGADGCIGGNAVTLRQYQHIATYHLATGDSLPVSISYHQRTWAGKIAEGIQRTLGFMFLVERDPDHDKDRQEQDKRFLQFAEEKIDDAAADEQQEHGFADDFQRDSGHTAPLVCRQFVVAFLFQPLHRFLFRKSLRELYFSSLYILHNTGHDPGSLS